MPRPLHVSFLALCLLLVAPTDVGAFGTASFRSLTSSSSKSSALYLLPHQGNQLAAWEAAHADDEPSLTHHSHHDDHHSRKQQLTAAREFVARVFSKPLLRRKIPPEEEIFVWQEHGKEKKRDVVYYPIVGFQYVKMGDLGCRAVPTLDAVCATCRLPPAREDLVGYYSPHAACRLQHWNEANDDTYAAAP